MRILVIEDNRALRDITAPLLASHGYEVLVADGGGEGLRLWREHGADLVLTDIHMGDMSGIDVVREIRAALPSLPVVVMSGSSDGDDLKLLRATAQPGSVALLMKPFLRDQLFATVDRELQGGPPASQS
jgi:two-component system cell cycle sensor histidine kinase/response regulator CckA